MDESVTPGPPHPLLQLTSGIKKRLNVGTPMLKWHGLTALPTYTFGTINVCLGAAGISVPFMESTGVVIAFLVALVFAATMMVRHAAKSKATSDVCV